MAQAVIALNRFGLGATPGQAPPADPQRWLIDQFGRYDPRPPVLATAPTTRAASAQLAEYLAARQALRRAKRAEAGQPDVPDDGATVPGEVAAAVSFARQQGRDNYASAAGLRLAAALDTPAPFVERLVHFWANHFALSAEKFQVIGLAGPFEFEAIRPHVLGSFRDLLFAAVRHPAMLLYLDQAQSIGPDSAAASLAARAQRQRALGLNENLAREILELHTLGVRAGYSQADVTEFARALTGWTVAGLGRGPAARAGQPGDFRFALALHQPGERMVLGKRYAAGGEEQAAAVLRDLAAHRATAHHIATKLVRHFVADDPPPAIVAACEAAFLASDGDLPTVYRALIAAPGAWAAQPAKFRTPWDWTVAALRGLGVRQFGAPQAVGLLQQLGQPMWRPGSPAGWDDIAASWAGPDALLRRVEAAERLAARVDLSFDPRTRAAELYPGALSTATAQAIARAESPAQGIALMLVAPEFLRR